MRTSSARASGGRTAATGATTLSTLLARRAAEAGAERALTWLSDTGATSLTWGELDRRVTAVAAALRQVTEPRQRAAVLIGPSPEFAVAFLGAIRAGLVAVPAGPDRPAHVMADAEPSIVLATAGTVAATRRFLSTLDTCGHRVLAVDAVPGAPDCPDEPVAAEDVAYLQYPRGVMVTHANIVVNARQAARVLGRGAVVSRQPPTEPLGLLLGLAVPITTGWPAVLGEPGVWPEPVSTLVSAADPDLNRLRKDFPGELRVCYALAEATALVSCGHPAGQRVAVVDPGGRRLPTGAIGEIWVSGPNVARGYWNRPAESARAFCALLTGDDEPRWWLRTGDFGSLGGSGELTVSGRGADLVAGYRPRDLEATVGEAHPAIGGSAAFATAGEHTVVVVELAEGVVPPRGEVERAVRAALSARHALTPRRVVVLTAEDAHFRNSYVAGVDGTR